MNEYQEIYNKLINELDSLKQGLIETQTIESKIAAKYENLELVLKELEENLKKLEQEKEEMPKKLYGKYYILPFIAYFITLFCSLSLIVVLSSIKTPLSHEIIYAMIILASCISSPVIALPIAVGISRLISKITSKKAMNSDEYKKVLEEIKSKKREIEIVNEQINIVLKEYQEAEENNYHQYLLINEKQGEITKLKDEVFYRSINTLPSISNDVLSSEEITDSKDLRPYTRIKKREKDKY